MKIVKIIFAVILIPALMGFAEVFYELIRDISSLHNSKLRIFMSGMAAYVPFYLLVLRRSGFVETFEHELTHMLFAKLFFKKTDKFFASERQGGFVATEGHNFIIALAPYFFPTLSFVLISLGFIIKEEFFTPLIALIGFSLSYHIVSTMKELRPGQSDIKGQGYIFSMVFIPTAIFIFYGIVLSFSFYGYDGLKDFCLSGYKASEGWYLSVNHKLNIYHYFGGR